MTIYKKLGEKIKKARLRERLSQEQLAEKCGLSTSYISCVERGTKKINIDKLFEISNLLNLILDIYPKNKVYSRFLSSDVFMFLETCNSIEKKFFYNTMKCIMTGIQENEFDW